MPLPGPTLGVGAEGINNPQVLYAFIRGAARQYGARWWADISTWNRFGNKQPYTPSPAAHRPASVPAHPQPPLREPLLKAPYVARLEAHDAVHVLACRFVHSED